VMQTLAERKIYFCLCNRVWALPCLAWPTCLCMMA
jgi:hypothetical protein